MIAVGSQAAHYSCRVTATKIKWQQHKPALAKLVILMDLMELLEWVRNKPVFSLLGLRRMRERRVGGARWGDFPVGNL